MLHCITYYYSYHHGSVRKCSSLIPSLSSRNPTAETSVVSTTTECDLAAEGSIECNDNSNQQSLIKPSVWAVFGDIATKTGASNLGQGFPDWSPPDFVLESLKEVATTSYHQYTRPAGHPPLVELISERYSRHLNRKIDPFNEVAITVGASQALYLMFMNFLKPGDEIILFEPFFDLYLKQIKVCGANPTYIPLGQSGATPDDPWGLDLKKLEAAITDKTKILLLNSPHNPTGKVFTLAELEGIAEIVKRFPNLIVISDEVYKFSIYNPIEVGDSTAFGHYHFARLPGMYDRTVTLSSCGKTFSVTGWQIGWLVGPAKFLSVVHNMLPCVQFCAATPMQHAFTSALKLADQPYEGFGSYYEWLRSQFQKKREILEEGLVASGIEPILSRGGFFLMGKLPYDEGIVQGSNSEYDEPYDWQYCRDLAVKHGVIGIPASPFFSSLQNAAQANHMARFAFCKKDDTLLAAANKLKNVKRR